MPEYRYPCPGCGRPYTVTRTGKVRQHFLLRHWTPERGAPDVWTNLGQVCDATGQRPGEYKPAS